MNQMAIPIPQARLGDFCRRWGIHELSLFGSVITEKFCPHSDVDVLFTLVPNRTLGWSEYFDMKTELESLFGRPVDLIERKVVEQSRNWIRRRQILQLGVHGPPEKLIALLAAAIRPDTDLDARSG